MHEEHAARLVHRIESFSDLVMGFSLALLGLTLVVPQHAAELFAHPWWLIGYFWTFAYIGGVWFNHQRLFEKYFVPTGPSILINFVMLSMLGLVVYFVQVFSHMQSDRDRAYAFIGYFAAFGISLIAIGTLYAIGTAARWKTLAVDDRRFGVRRASRSIVLGGLLFGTVTYYFAFAPSFSMASLAWLAVVALAGSAAVRIALRFAEPHLMVAEGAVAP